MGLDFLKALFNNGALTFEEFVTAVNSQKKEDGKPKFKLVNLEDGGYVDVNRFNNANTRITDLEGQLATRNTDLAKLQSQVGENETLKTTLAALQANYNDLDSQSKAKIKAMERQTSIMSALVEAGVKPKLTKAAMALLSEDTLKEDLSGITTETARLKKDYSEFFSDSSPAGTGFDGAGGSGAGGGTGGVDLDKLSDAEFYAFLASQKK